MKIFCFPVFRTGFQAGKLFPLKSNIVLSFFNRGIAIPIKIAISIKNKHIFGEKSDYVVH